jgi:hypothetical protein
MRKTKGNELKITNNGSLFTYPYALEHIKVDQGDLLGHFHGLEFEEHFREGGHHRRLAPDNINH